MMRHLTGSSMIAFDYADLLGLLSKYHMFQ